MMIIDRALTNVHIQIYYFKKKGVASNNHYFEKTKK